jgi:hypothetical protein
MDTDCDLRVWNVTGGSATMTGIRVNYRGAQLSRRVHVDGDRVVTELLVAGPWKLWYSDAIGKRTELEVGTPLTHPRGKAAIAYVSQ